MGGTELEDRVADAFRKAGFIVFVRKNRCDVLAVNLKAELAYLIECKDYELSAKHQRLAVRELNRNYTHALEVLLANKLFVKKVLKVLVARGFAYRARGILQFTPEDLEKHASGR
ncbi:hypothetical protein [Thermofilum sp.]|uniref:hypothetical protein n=1 Tax=Thermofilum sp. TaxID=1961369 RepID=UPI003161EFCB